MTLVQYLFEGQPQGTVLTTGNTGASQVTLNGAAGIFDSAVKAHGDMGAKFTSVANTNSIMRLLANAANNQVGFSTVVQLPAANEVNGFTLFTLRSSSGVVLRVQYGGTSSGGTNVGKLWVLDAGSTVYSIANAGDYAFGGKYRFDLVVTGGSATAGVISAKMFDFATGTQIGSTVTTSTANLTMSPIVGGDFGIIQTNNVAGDVVGYDDIQFNDGASTAPPPVTDSTVTITGSTTLTDNQTIITVTGSGGTAPYTYSIGQLSGPTTAAVDLGGGKFLVHRDTSSTLVYQVTISDSLGHTGTLNVNVGPAAVVSAVWPKSPTGTLPSSTWG